MKITRAWLGDQLDEDVLERGEACFLNGQVCEMEVLDKGHAISGEVEDDARYSVYIDVDKFGVDGDCSCSTGYNCEHVAALLMACLSAQEDNQARPSTDMDIKSSTVAPQPPVEGADILTQELERNIYPPDVHQRILYLLRPEPNGFHVRVNVVSARCLKDGGFGALAPFYLSNLGKHVLHRFIMPVDAHILQCITGNHCEKSSFLPSGAGAANMMLRLLKTGRCYWLDTSQPALKAGEARTGIWHWHMDSEVRQHLRLSLGDAIHDNQSVQPVLPTTPPLYVDVDTGACGLIENACPDDVCESLLFTPPIEPDDPLPLGGLSFDWPTGINKPDTLNVRRKQQAPKPVLQLVSAENPDTDGIRLMFDYGGKLLPLGHGVRQVYAQKNGQWWVTSTDANAELTSVQQLFNADLIMNPALEASTTHAELAPYWLLSNTVNDASWPAFLTATLPRLRQAGFRIETMSGFRYEIVQVRQWDARCKDHGIMGEIHFEVVLDDGLHIDLIQLVANWIKAEPERLSEASLQQLAGIGVQYLPLPDGRMLPIAGEMLHGMLVAMLDVFSMASKHTTDEYADTCNTTAMQWLALRDVLIKPREDALYIQIQDDAVWRDRMRQLAEMRDIPNIAPPTGLSVSLRSYQQHGLNWLQNLRRMNVGALLADDMGLGKTIQTLAHILKEKESGRLSTPALVIAPTSLMHNWQAEAVRFTPDLNVLLLHGTHRKEVFSSIGKHDLVLTTYGLLHRDSNALKRQHWAMLILDEAQKIRNPRTAAARAARDMQADQRICLTGTPMENHLGELWALFDFIMPGYLSDSRTFSRCFRKPIEREADSQRQAQLNLRIRPFMLRRTKQAVATELPAKTEIIRTVEMGDKQRELYEGVRLLIHQQVLDAMQRAGKGKSTIIMLTALLKMRQVCCDPRLLKYSMLKYSILKETAQDQGLAESKNKTATIPTTPTITLESIDQAGSAKLDLLREMLPEMIAEGRRILLFSQFTRMLKLIADLCDELAIPYVTLTGSTRDRATPVNAFQNHDAPLFLISLKAGGVGLNLTAADSVIHYDPWWNPAAEAQASDRAHRIGQDKPVFVYKLITGGSVESRILDMQVRKQKLADALYKGSKQSKLTWSDVELESLFAPLEAFE